MKANSTDGQSEPKETPWPSVLKIPGDEFQQSFAVAQLALKLWQASKTSNVKSIEKADPKDFLADAWELIESAREHVMRPQTDLEYLIEQGSPRDALAAIFGRRDRERMILFARLCDPNRNKGDTEMIKLPDAESEKTIEVEWKVYCSERGFDDLFLAYWRDLGEQWTEWMKGEKPRALWMKKDAVTFWKLAHNKEKYPGGFKQLWKERGQSVLASWKRDGVPANAFLALAKFRREHDKRAANLKPKQKRKNRRTTVKSRVGARKHRTR